MAAISASVNSFFYPGQHWSEKNISRFRNRAPFQNREIVDERTGDRYRTDGLLTRKCIAIFIFMVPLFLLHVTWYASKAVINSAYITYTKSQELADQSIPHKISKIFFSVIKNISYCIKQVVRSAFYALSIQFAILTRAPFSSYEARKHIATLEEKWHEKSWREHDVLIRNSVSGTEEYFDAIIDSLVDKTDDVFYLAGCFQRLGNVSDETVYSVENLS